MIRDLSHLIQTGKAATITFTDEAVSTVASETKNAFERLENLVGEPERVINNLATNLTHSVNDLDATTGKLRTAFLEATNAAASSITDATNRAVSTLKATTEQSTGRLNDATAIAVHKLNDATSSVTQTAEQTKFALDETLQKAEQLSAAISTSVQDVVATSLTKWMIDHPMLSWVISHPLWTIALVLLALLLGWSLIGAIAQFTQRVWLFILQTPLKLIQSLSQGALQSFNRANTLPSIPLNAPLDTQKRLHEILSRLEILRQEQEGLMTELQAILLFKHLENDQTEIG